MKVPQSRRKLYGYELNMWSKARSGIQQAKKVALEAKARNTEFNNKRQVSVNLNITTLSQQHHCRPRPAPLQASSLLARTSLVISLSPFFSPECLPAHGALLGSWDTDRCPLKLILKLLNKWTDSCSCVKNLTNVKQWALNIWLDISCRAVHLYSNNPRHFSSTFFQFVILFWNFLSLYLRKQCSVRKAKMDFYLSPTSFPFSTTFRHCKDESISIYRKIH